LGFAQFHLIDCYRDASVLNHIGIPFSEAFQSLQTGRVCEAMKAHSPKQTPVRQISLLSCFLADFFLS